MVPFRRDFEPVLVSQSAKVVKSYFGFEDNFGAGKSRFALSSLEFHPVGDRLAVKAFLVSASGIGCARISADEFS